ncbi:MAG: NAD(P)-dependent oxidoreductase [Rhodospirillales bacterium]
MTAAIITGTSSFIGAHLACAFARAGHAVTATHSRPLAAYDGIRAARLSFAEQSASLAELDITDGDAVRRLADKVKPQLWVHHAGHAVDYSSPDYDAETGRAVNVQPLSTIFSAMARTGGGVLITGSSAEYASSDQANTEDDIAAPELPYGASKLAETEHARLLSAETGVPVRIGRLYIPFGRLDHPAKLLAQAVTALKDGQPVDLSPCSQQRDFVGVDDVCRAWIAMAADLGRGGFDVFNICSGEATELRRLLLEIAGALGADTNLLRFGERPMRPGEPPVSYGDNAKAGRMLNWTPRPLNQAIREDLLEDPAAEPTCA